MNNTYTPVLIVALLDDIAARCNVKEDIESDIYQARVWAHTADRLRKVAAQTRAEWRTIGEL